MTPASRPCRPPCTATSRHASALWRSRQRGSRGATPTPCPLRSFGRPCGPPRSELSCGLPGSVGSSSKGSKSQASQARQLSPERERERESGSMAGALRTHWQPVFAAKHVDVAAVH
eukprot:8324493-Pyramimonas_sp.AAC.1